jgi:hypothetical protein
VGSLASGAALLAHLLAGIALPLALAFTVGLLALTIVLVWRRTKPAERRPLATYTLVGLGVGLVATIVYDVVRVVLAEFDPSPYNPFEAIRMFGILLAGPDAPAGLSMTAGFAFHFVNGIAFGIAYCFLFGRRGLVAGILWGLFLELFQVTLYPGWLNIRAYQEFVQISALGHIAYGAVLGWGCQASLRRWGSAPPAGTTSR